MATTIAASLSPVKVTCDGQTVSRAVSCIGQRAPRLMDGLLEDPSQHRLRSPAQDRADASPLQ
ncbi:hypothetical protein ACIQC7_35305 [Kitasatospora sp. NPDC088556]|uniref:hypothetical protein n=1 Tax=Kitasatospora sp. NPDC088556 TaxID=3364076 RepID=UPI0037FDCA4F